MDLNRAVRERRSVRAFLPDAVPREKIERMVDLARWAPSWGNTQPWEVVVADGEKAKELARLFEEAGRAVTNPRPDVEMPIEFTEPYKDRYMGLGRDLLTFMGIERGDKAARMEHYMNMYKFFGAPACIYLIIDKELTVPYSCLDLGSFGTTLCYAALQEGLGTIYLAASMHFPDIVRTVLDIPERKRVIIGIAVGFPHPEAPASIFRSSRVPVEEILRFA
jgi:nitroreductase